jgi:hypothetical protein
MRWFVLVVVLLGSAAARADSRIDCAEHVEVRLGMSESDVVARCGRPTSYAERIEPRPSLDQQGNCGCHDCGCCAPPPPIVIHDLAYDLGPDRFVRQLHFEDGVLREISTGFYGADP